MSGLVEGPSCGHDVSALESAIRLSIRGNATSQRGATQVTNPLDSHYLAHSGQDRNRGRGPLALHQHPA
jgi:hypothetical protein